MAKLVNCPCGEVVRSESDGELVAVEEHVKTAHPDQVGQRTREDFLGMAEEDAA